MLKRQGQVVRKKKKWVLRYCSTIQVGGISGCTLYLCRSSAENQAPAFRGLRRLKCPQLFVDGASGVPRRPRRFWCVVAETSRAELHNPVPRVGVRGSTACADVRLLLVACVLGLWGCPCSPSLELRPYPVSQRLPTHRLISRRTYLDCLLDFLCCAWEQKKNLDAV